jgi:histidyl-tRNA synthetase
VSDATAKKEERRKFQAIRGTRDLLPPETELWNRVEQTAHEVFATFGYGEIRLPIFEPTELFARSIGVDTDVVSKEMYAVDERGVLQLEQVRSALVIRKSLSVIDLQAFSLYERQIGDFLKRVSEKLANGDVPRTSENEQALQSIPAFLVRMNELLGKSLEGTSDDYAEAFEKHETALKKALNSFRFENVPAADQDATLVTLRPEATASVCRAYIEHNMQQLPQPVKLYYMGPMFRRERPQKGRYRQFYQIGAEILGGTDAPAIDAEVIEMLMTYFDKVGLQGATLYINSIGHNADNCRRGYVEKLRVALERVKDKLGPDSQRRIDTNPLRVLDSKLESEQAIIATLPHIADHLCDECKTHYAEVKRQLQVRGVLYQENWRLVRGLDYYMRTTFEITAPGLGSQNAVCGGGRYDGLVELLGGPPTKGIGFAIGEDRLILSLQESGKGQVQQGRDIYIAWMGEKAHATAIRAAKDLRKAGYSVDLPPLEQKFGKALGQADKLGAKYALILGDNEVSEGLWTLKTLSDGTQQKLTESDLLEFLRQQEKVSS